MNHAPDDLQELLSTAHNRFTTIQAAWHYWSHPARNAAANEQERRRNRYTGEQTPLIRPKGEDGTPPPPHLPPEHEINYRLWLSKPSSSWRYEADWPTSNGPVTRQSITNGPLWWIHDPLLFGKQTNAKIDVNLAADIGPPRPNLPPTARRGAPNYLGDPTSQTWLDPSAEPEAFSMELQGQTTHAGRKALRVQALVRSEIEDLEPPPGLWLGADEIELLIDRQRGIILRATGYINGQPFARTEIRQITFDHPLPNTLFAIPPTT